MPRKSYKSKSKNRKSKSRKSSKRRKTKRVGPKSTHKRLLIANGGSSDFDNCQDRSFWVTGGRRTADSVPEDTYDDSD